MSFTDRFSGPRYVQLIKKRVYFLFIYFFIVSNVFGKTMHDSVRVSLQLTEENNVGHSEIRDERAQFLTARYILVMGRLTLCDRLTNINGVLGLCARYWFGELCLFVNMRSKVAVKSVLISWTRKIVDNTLWIIRKRESGRSSGWSGPSWTLRISTSCLRSVFVSWRQFERRLSDRYNRLPPPINVLQDRNTRADNVTKTQLLFRRCVCIFFFILFCTQYPDVGGVYATIHLCVCGVYTE